MSWSWRPRERACFWEGHCPWFRSDLAPCCNAFLSHLKSITINIPIEWYSGYQLMVSSVISAFQLSTSICQACSNLLPLPLPLAAEPESLSLRPEDLRVMNDLCMFDQFSLWVSLCGVVCAGQGQLYVIWYICILMYIIQISIHVYNRNTYYVNML